MLTNGSPNWSEFRFKAIFGLQLWSAEICRSKNGIRSESCDRLSDGAARDWPGCRQTEVRHQLLELPILILELLQLAWFTWI